MISLSSKMVDMEQGFNSLMTNVMDLIHHQRLQVDSLEVKCGHLRSLVVTFHLISISLVSNNQGEGKLRAIEDDTVSKF
jgi:hypothetical protein